MGIVGVRLGVADGVGVDVGVLVGVGVASLKRITGKKFGKPVLVCVAVMAGLLAGAN